MPIWLRVFCKVCLAQPAIPSTIGSGLKRQLDDIESYERIQTRPFQSTRWSASCEPLFDEARLFSLSYWAFLAIWAKMQGGDAKMIQTLEAVIDEQGNVRLLEPLRLPEARRALVTVLEERRGARVSEASLLSERALAADWNRPEEDEAWEHLQQVR